MMRDRKPHFFKVLLGDFKRRLKIPPRFMKHIAKEVSQRIVLQGPNRSFWQVELRKTIRGYFLSAGWSNFVNDHSLKKYEFLVFKHEGNMHFSVMIFDASACQREDVFEIKTHTKIACRRMNKWGPPLKRSSDTNRILQHQSRGTKPLLSDKKDALKKLQELFPSSKATSDSNSNTKTVGLAASKPKRAKICLSSRRPVTTEERSKAEKAADSFRSPFPYTIIRMMAYNVYKNFMLNLPACFSRTHLPREKTNIFLRDPSGKAWKVVYIPKVDHANSNPARLSGGWAAFVHGNKLEEGDFCAFELIGEIELKVHIFRVVEEATQLALLSLMYH